MKTFSIYRTCRRDAPDKNPDWHEPYDHMAEWTDDAVAFEFLRRNLEYWKLWYELLSNSDHADQEPYENLVNRAVKEFGLLQCPDPRLPIAGQNILLWTVTASISSRYAYVVREADVGRKPMQYRFGRHAPPDTVTIDLRADGPVDSQIQFVRWVLNRVRSSMSLDRRAAPRLRRDLYTEYLRLLDARDDGASFATIAKLIYGGRSAADDLIRKRLKAARELCDGGYRHILLWGHVHIPDRVAPFPHELDDLSVELWNLAESGDHEGFDKVMARFVQALNG